jgi:transcriptional regulator with XRE-family HTH domain
MSKPILKAFGSNARRLRLKHKLTHEQLAELSGLHPNYIGGIERGERNLSLITIVRLSRALQCRIGDLFTGVPASDKSGS